MSLPIEASSETVRLRTISVADVSEAYVRWMNDVEVNRYLESRFVTHTIETLTEFVTAMDADDRHVFAAIIDRSSGLHIGNIKLGPIDPHHLTGDIGLLIGERSHWGRGYASQAVRLMTAHTFEHLGLMKVTASAYGANQGSVKAFLNAGFELEGRRRDQFRVDGDRDDAVLLGRCRP